MFSQLRYVSYDFDKQLLDISFRDGALRHYVGVPSTIFFSLVNAYSTDRYFNENIRPNFFCTNNC